LIPGKIEKLIGKEFRHFKGGHYIVAGAVLDAESEEWKVLYCALTPFQKLPVHYCRSYANFTELVNGKPRFEEV
jgi:hypothetical protein